MDTVTSSFILTAGSGAEVRSAPYSYNMGRLRTVSDRHKRQVE